MNPEIVERPTVTLIGFEGRFISGMSPDSNTKEIIYPLWEKLTERKGEIRATANGIFYGACRGLPASVRARDDELVYLAAVPVAPDEPAVPTGMVKWTIPSGTYARFVHRGPISRLVETVQRAHAVWIGKSSYETDRRPELEYYDHRFRGDDPENELDYLMPVRLRKVSRATPPARG